MPEQYRLSYTVAGHPPVVSPDVVARDLPWDHLVTTAAELAGRYGEDVRPTQRHRLRWVVAGFEAPAFAVFEPVMRRRRFSRDWEQLVPIQEAAARAAAVLREGT